MKSGVRRAATELHYLPSGSPEGNRRLSPTPMRAFACAIVRSAAAISGRARAVVMERQREFQERVSSEALWVRRRLTRRFADQRGDGVFEYRAIRRNADPHGLCALKRYLRLRDGFRDCRCLYPRARASTRAPSDRLRSSGCTDPSTRLVREAESRNSQEWLVRMKLLIFEIGCTDLGRVLEFANRVADLGPTGPEPRTHRSVANIR